VSEARAYLSPTRDADPYAYAGRPVEYAEEVLGIHTLTDEQRQILRGLHEPPHRVLVASAHDVGKTFIAAVAANYWYDSFNPGLVLTTAPTERDVNDLLWTELRLQRQRAGLDCTGLAPRTADMRTGPDHYATGYVSRLGQGFQGRHRDRMLFIKDEADGVAPLHFITTDTMCDPALGCAEICIFNPTNVTSQVYQEDMRCDDPDGTPKWHRIRLSALDHPNIRAELRGQPRPIPGAVSLDMVTLWLQDWCEPVEYAEDVVATDVEFPPGSCRWYRPGPIFQARALGLWPDTGAGVWSPALWQACFPLYEPPLPLDRLPEIGCDCSMGKGEDFYALHCRWGAVSLYHETSNVMDAVRIASRIRLACQAMADEANRHRPRGAPRVTPQQIRVRIDDDGIGNAVAAMLKREAYLTELVSAASVASKPGLYPRKRDEAWFHAAEKARAGLVCLSRLDKKTLARLRQQLLAPAWDVDTAGRRAVERKDETRDKIGRSPDDADAFNLAYLDTGSAVGGSIPNQPRGPRTAFGGPDEPRGGGRRMFGLE
jgi:hypothetical protein